MKFYEFSDINRAMADARRGDAIKPVLPIGSCTKSAHVCFFFATPALQKFDIEHKIVLSGFMTMKLC